jgi:hypothetical protein
MKALRLNLSALVAGGVLLLAGCQDVPSPVAPIEAPDDALSSRSQAPHSGQELQDLFARVAPEVMALGGTVFADHHEDTGQLVFGVENGAAAFGVQRALTRLEVPGTAYTVRVVEPIHFASDNLRSQHRPTQGGIQIHWGQYVCTLGFNVDHPDGRSFITNSHCTDKQGSTGTTAYYQPLSSVDSSPIAIEADDPEYTKEGCSRGKVCRYSDAARALYQSGAESTRGRIAKTTGENNGSLTVNGHFSVDTQDDANTSFSGTLHKVGRTTGWSSGNVTNSCATVNVSGSNIQLLCQTLVQNPDAVIAQGGDSGSPVFRLGSQNSVELVGILWGGSSSGDRFVFSPLKNVQDELGSFTATSNGNDGGGGDGGDDGDDGEDEVGDNPPTIETFDVSTSVTGPWNRATVTWAVSDVDGDLAQVVIELLSGDDVLDSATISVSGDSASGETGLRSRTQPTSVRLTVTDAAGHPVSGTKNY